jgi:hypothetical protein
LHTNATIIAKHKEKKQQQMTGFSLEKAVKNGWPLFGKQAVEWIQNSPIAQFTI